MFGWGPPHDWPAGTHQASAPSAASSSSRASARFSAIPGRADRGTTRVHPATSPATKANKPIGTVRKDKAHWLHQRAGEAGKNWYVGIMGFNTAILIADSVLTDDTVKTLNLVPVGGQITAEAVLLTPSDTRACVVREGGSTIILDGGESLTTAADEGRLGIPGTVHFAATVSSVDFSEFTVVSNGEIVRHLCYEDGETTIDVGEPVPGESRWLITADDGDDETRTGEPAEAEIEVDGDILIQKLPEMAGLSPDLDVFALVGAAYDAFEEQGETTDPGALEGEETGEEGSAKRPGFFGRLFGR